MKSVREVFASLPQDKFLDHNDKEILSFEFKKYDSPSFNMFSLDDGAFLDMLRPLTPDVIAALQEPIPYSSVSIYDGDLDVDNPTIRRRRIDEIQADLRQTSSFREAETFETRNAILIEKDRLERELYALVEYDSSTPTNGQRVRDVLVQCDEDYEYVKHSGLANIPICSLSLPEVSPVLQLPVEERCPQPEFDVDFMYLFSFEALSNAQRLEYLKRSLDVLKRNYQVCRRKYGDNVPVPDAFDFCLIPNRILFFKRFYSVHPLFDTLFVVASLFHEMPFIMKVKPNIATIGRIIDFLYDDDPRIVTLEFPTLRYLRTTRWCPAPFCTKRDWTFQSIFDVFRALLIGYTMQNDFRQVFDVPRFGCLIVQLLTYLRSKRRSRLAAIVKDIVFILSYKLKVIDPEYKIIPDF